MLAAAIETLQSMDVRDRGNIGRSEAGAERLAEKAQLLRREIERLKPRETTDADKRAPEAGRS
jgi:hypothetical protein